MPDSKPKRILYASHWWIEDQMACAAREAIERHWHVDFQMCVTNRLPRQWRGDGIVTTLSGDPVEMAGFLARAGCPAVSLNQYHPGIDVPCVSMDMEVAGRMSADHFLERGFHSFAHYTRNDWDHTKLPYLPFEQAVLKTERAVNRLNWQEEKETWVDTWDDRHLWLRKRLRELPRPLAVLAVEPLAAVEVIEAALEEDLDVPDDVAVLGLFDIELFRQSTTVPLSCLIQDFGRQVRVACDLLARMMDGEAAPAAPTLLPPAGIAIRRSTDTIAARTPAVAKAVRYMCKHFEAPITVEMLADLCGQSRTRLYELFDADLGASPHAVLARIRLEKAKSMLVETHEKVRTVAETCGFGSPVNLFRHFQRQVGTSPAAYRKREKAT